MSQQDLIQFIHKNFDEGKNQDEVRQLAKKLSVRDEQYAAALVAVLSERLVEEAPRRTAVPPTVLIVLALVLIAAGIVFVVALSGEFAVAVGMAAIAFGIGVALWARRKIRASRR